MSGWLSTVREQEESGREGANSVAVRSSKRSSHDVCDVCVVVVLLSSQRPTSSMVRIEASATMRRYSRGNGRMHPLSCWIITHSCVSLPSPCPLHPRLCRDQHAVRHDQ